MPCSEVCLLLFKRHVEETLSAVKCSDLSHFIGGQLKVKNIEVAAMKPVRAMSAEEAGLEIRNNDILSYTGNTEVLDFYKNVNAYFSKIGYRAFYRCESLRVIILPATCSWIDAQAFFGCPNLERVDIGNRSVMFGDEAFADCGKLTEVIMERDPGKIYPHNVFAGTPFERNRRDSLTLGDNSGT